MKKKLSDMVFSRITPPDHLDSIGKEQMADVFVRRLGLIRKESKADHAALLLELLKFKKDNIPLSVEQISNVLGISQSQTYEELRKWRSLGLVEFVKIPSGADFSKGYLLSANTTNRLLDKVESSLKVFMRETRRIGKDFDDLMLIDRAKKDNNLNKAKEE
jgi:predicted transcriptional regulator